jgi:hypothetical protein
MMVMERLEEQEAVGTAPSADGSLTRESGRRAVRFPGEVEHAFAAGHAQRPQINTPPDALPTAIGSLSTAVKLPADQFGVRVNRADVLRADASGFVRGRPRMSELSRQLLADFLAFTGSFRPFLSPIVGNCCFLLSLQTLQHFRIHSALCVHMIVIFS